VNKEEVGVTVKRVRLEHDCSQELLAEVAGVGIGTIRRIESGKQVGFETLRQVLMAMGIDFKGGKVK